jgi:hypothetical protein
MNNPIEFQLHYFLEDKNSHIMNANIHNESEHYMLTAIKNLQKYLECEIKVEVLPKEKGGLINIYRVFVENPVIVILSAVFGAWANNFFRPAIHKTDEQKNRIEIIEKLKQGNFTKEELDFIIQSDGELSKLKSLYYKNISKEPTILKIETETYTDKKTAQEKTEIKKIQFIGHIIEKSENITSTEVQATIYIVAPVLISGRKLPWRGIYISQPIEFRVEDKKFLKQVYNHEIKFGTGTSITCTLKIETKTKTVIATLLEDESISETYHVRNVSHWADDDHFQYETKRYKKIKEDKRQTSINFF